MSNEDTITRLVAWAERREDIRAVLLTSTRAVPHAATDALSDYDVVLVVADVRPFVEDRRWLEDFGELLVVFWDAVYPDPDYGLEQTGNVAQYADGLKIDFTVCPVEYLRRAAAAPALPDELDAGYRVLLDKDGLADALAPPSYRAYVPARPTEAEYLTHINDFLTDAPYVAKCLWRDELLPAKWCLDHDMKHAYLRPVLEWLVSCDSGWSKPVGSLGKGLKKRLPPELWAEVEAAYAGGGIAENWEALERTVAVFRRAAVEVGERLGYAYPHELERRVMAYVRQIRAMPPAGVIAHRGSWGSAIGAEPPV